MYQRLLGSTFAAVLGLLPIGASATTHKKPEPPKPECQKDAGQLRGHLDRCQKERDAARAEVGKLTDSLTRAAHELRTSKANEARLAKEVEALNGNLAAAGGKRKELEQALAKAFQNRGERSAEIERLTAALQQHAANQKRDADALAAARYQIEQAKSQLHASIKTRQTIEGKLAEANKRAGDAEQQVAALQKIIAEKDALQQRTQQEIASVQSAFHKAQDELKAAAADRKALADALTGERAKFAEAADKIRRLTESSTATSAEFEKSKVELATTRNRLAAAETALAASQKKHAETSAELARQSKAAKDAAAEMTRLNSSLKQLTGSQNQTKADLESTQKRLAAAQASASECAKKLHAAETGRKELGDTLAKANAEIATAKVEIETLTKTGASQSAKQKETESALATARAEVVRLQSVLKSSGEAHRALEAKLAESEKKQAEAKTENDRLAKAHHELGEAHKRTVTVLAATRSELAKAQGEIAKLSELKKEHHALEGRYRELAAKHEVALKELKARHDALAHAGNTIAGLEKKRAEDSDLIRRLTGELDAAREASHAADKRHEALRGEIAGIRETLTRVAEIGEAHKELQRRHHALQDECNSAQREVEKWKAAHRCCEEKLHATVKGLDAAKSAIAQIEATLRENESRRVDTERKLAESLSRGAESRKALADLHAKLKESEHHRHQLSEERKKLADALANSENHQKRSEHEIVTLREALHSVESKLSEANKSRIQREAELSEATRNATRVLESAKELRGEIAKRDTVIAQLKQENDQLRHHLARAQKEAEHAKHLEAELARCQSQLKGATDALAASESKRKDIDSKLRTANHEIAQLKAQLAKREEGNAEAVAKLTAEVTDITKLLEICTAKHATLKSDLAGSEKARAELVAANRKLAAQLEDALNAKPDEKIVRELSDIRARLEASEKARQAAEKLVISLKIQMASIQKEATAFREQLVRIDPVYYYINCADIEEQQSRVLSQVREVLHYYPTSTFHLVGHTCNVGSANSNLALSKKRAALLSSFLAKHGIPASKITTEGVGESQPAADNSSEIGRRLNRHVAIQVDLHID